MTVSAAIQAAVATQEAVDALRLEAGWQAFCPVCRRPASDGPIGFTTAARRLAVHITKDHDPALARLLEIWLRAASRQAPPVSEW